METIDITWDEFMKSDDEAKRDLIVRGVAPDAQDWEKTRERMAQFATQLGLKNPAPLYRVAYNVGAVTMPEELVALKARAKKAKAIRLVRREHAEEKLAQPEIQQPTHHGDDVANAQLQAFLTSDTIETRVAALEALVREMAEEMKLLRRVILLMK